MNTFYTKNRTHYSISDVVQNPIYNWPYRGTGTVLWQWMGAEDCAAVHIRTVVSYLLNMFKWSARLGRMNHDAIFRRDYPSSWYFFTLKWTYTCDKLQSWSLHAYNCKEQGSYPFLAIYSLTLNLCMLDDVSKWEVWHPCPLTY